MTDKVTLKTAQRLEEAGWPQFDKKTREVGPHIPLENGGFLATPSATDLLEAIPGAALTLDTNGKWVVFEVGTPICLSDWHDNPAEACAEAWLSWRSRTENADERIAKTAIDSTESDRTLAIELGPIVAFRGNPMPTCRVCGGYMSEGIAIQNEPCATSEWSDGDMTGATFGPSSEGTIVRVMKCAGPTGCGHSYKI